LYQKNEIDTEALGEPAGRSRGDPDFGISFLGAPASYVGGVILGNDASEDAPFTVVA
jgi:hypothetical protein